MTRFPVTAALLALAAHGLVAGGAATQSLTTGEVAGVVADGIGLPLTNVQVTVRRMGGSLPVIVESDRDGMFLVPWLSPGDYEVRVERLGFRPVVLAPVPVHADRRINIRVTLTRVEGVVEAPEREVYEGGAMAAASRPGRSRLFGALERETVPLRTGELDELTRLSTYGEAPVEVEGLPFSTGRLMVGGLLHRPASLGTGRAPVRPALVAPVLPLEGTELLAGRPDVEWPSTAGGILSAALDGAPAGFGGTLAGTGSGAGLVLDDAVDPELLRGGLVVGGSMVGDSAGGWVFAEVQRRTAPEWSWPVAGGELAAELGDAGVDVSPLVDERLGASDRLNLGGRFEWRLPGGHHVDLFALYGDGEDEHFGPGLTGLAVPATVGLSDLLAGGTVTTRLTDRVDAQLRLGFSQSIRSVDPRLDIATGFGDATVLLTEGNALIGDAALDSEATRSEFAVDGTLFYRTGPHLLKAGGGARFGRHERSLDFDRATTLAFADPGALAAGRGVRLELDGPTGSIDFSRNEYFLYAQNVWRAASGLDLTTGLRYDLEGLPREDIRANTRWETLTGIGTAAIRERRGSLGLVTGFEWDVQERAEWQVRGDFTIQQGDIPADVFADAVRYDGRVEAAGAFGDVNGSTMALGPRLTVLSPELEPAVTTRASLGISRAVGSAVIHLAGVLRDTENLPERVDANLPLDAAYSDQYGRPVFGDLAREGALLYAAPNGNRRFQELDAVAGVSSTASSRYWGVTAGLEKRLGLLRAVASYTYSETRDDWFAAGTAPDPRLDRDWVDGTSDFDVPHRLVTIAELAMPFLPGVRIGAAWQRSSGRPFTPGYGHAIDANADGIAGNDPAFVDGAVDGIDPLLDQWSCLVDHLGDFVERNACRGETRTLLDGWLAARIPIGGVATELRVEALGLEAGGGGIIDTALFRLDPNGSLVAQGGVIEVPLVANPGFGSELVGSREVSRLRISLRMEF